MVAPPWYEVPPDRYGGIEWVCSWLTDGLIERGHEVFLIGAGRDLTKAKFFSTYDVPPTHLLGNVLPEAVHSARAYGHLGDLDVDIVHDHSFLGPMTAGARSVPTILTVHTPAEGDLAEYYGSFGSRFRLVAISERQRRLSPELPWFATVRNGIPVADYPFIEEKEDFVLFVGRMSPDKAPHLAIQAAREAGLPLIIAAKCTEVHEFEYFEAFVKPVLGHDVNYIGEADTITKKDLLGRARALVCPMQWEEPFGIVMVEALSCGTPVVAFPRGAVPEIVEHGVSGIICLDASELPAAIHATANLDPHDCRKRAETLFDTAPMIAGYESVYQRALLEEGLI